ncbi:MAG: hypothetical protein ACO3P5_10275 [Steroidobacteraceae bacterium]
MPSRQKNGISRSETGVAARTAVCCDIIYWALTLRGAPKCIRFEWN